jgi:hypothetical protein
MAVGGRSAKTGATEASPVGARRGAGTASTGAGLTLLLAFCVTAGAMAVGGRFSKTGATPGAGGARRGADPGACCWDFGTSAAVCDDEDVVDPGPWGVE